MSENFFQNPDLIKKLEQYDKRIESLAKAENKSKREIIASERERILDDMDRLLGEAMDKIKKRFPREKYGLESHIDERYRRNVDFAKKLAFAA